MPAVLMPKHWLICPTVAGLPMLLWRKAVWVPSGAAGAPKALPLAWMPALPVKVQRCTCGIVGVAVGSRGFEAAVG